MAFAISLEKSLAMTQIKIKRVYDPQHSDDGYRVLVDKLWPRGMRKENLHYDLWAKDIAPSTPLRQWYHNDPENDWGEFKQKYLQELKQTPAVRDFTDKIKSEKTVTLLYASKNTIENHASILQDYLHKLLK